MNKHNKVAIISVLVCTMFLGGLTAVFASPIRNGFDHFTYLPLVMNRYSPPNVTNVAELISFMQLAGEDCSEPYTIDLAPGIYTLIDVNNEGNGLPVVSCDITINGNASTIKRGSTAPEFRIFEINSTGKLTLNNITISDGRTTQMGGALSNNGGILEINNSTFSSNASIRFNGLGIGQAGAVYNEGGTVNIIDSTFSGNQATRGDGAIRNDDDGTLTVTNTIFINNDGGNSGGGIENISGTVTIIGSSFTGNKISAFGVGGAIVNWGNMTISNSQFIANLGGGIFNYGDQLSINNSCISGNSPDSTGRVIFNNSNTPLDARSNWWGESNGPSGAGPGSGDSISYNVEFAPFLTASIPNCSTDTIVSSVVITASGAKYNSMYYVSPNSSFALSAKVYGANLLTHDVAWSIVSGGGSLSDTSGSSATFTSPATNSVTTIRASALEDPSKYSDITIGTATISVWIPRTSATVLTGGSVPLFALVVVGGAYDYLPNNLAWSIVSGNGTIDYIWDINTYTIYTAAESTGTTIVRASAVADPSKYVDITITVNSSGPVTCSNPPVIPSGDLEFIVSGNWGADMPAMGAGIIGNSDPLMGETQTLTIEAAVTNPKTSPLTSVTVTLITDNGRRPAQPLYLISGTYYGGQWQGSYLVDDTHCDKYQIEIIATNATGASTVTITLH